MTAGAVRLTWNNERSSCSRAQCSYLYVTSVWNTTNDLFLKKMMKKQKQKSLVCKWSMKPTTSNPILFELGSDAFILGTETEWGGCGWVGQYGAKPSPLRSHVPPPSTCLPLPPLKDNVCVGLSAVQHHARLWILPLAASLFDFSGKLVWIEAGGFLKAEISAPASSLHLATQGALHSLSLSAINCASAEMIYF